MFEQIGYSASYLTKTSKTEVLQTPSATEVNLAQGVARSFEYLKKNKTFEFLKNFEF